MSEADFLDDFTDGDFTDRWEIYVDRGDFSAEVVSGETEPDGDNVQLSVSQTQGGGTRGLIGWAEGEEMEGWDQQWTLEGEFYTEEASINVPFQQHPIYAAYRPADETSSEDRPLNLNCGFTNGSNNIIPFKIDGSLIETKEEVYEFDWQEDTWYNYKMEHDGDGRYTAKIWTNSESEPTDPDAISTGPTPPSGPRVGAIQVNGGRSEPLQLQHGSMGWTRGSSPDTPTTVSASMTTLQAIPGGEENRDNGGDPLDSALPKFFLESDPGGFNPLLDSWFQGDMLDAHYDEGTLPEDLGQALEEREGKYELRPRQSFNDYRFDNGLIVEFDVMDDGSIDQETISITFAEAGPDPDDQNVELGNRSSSTTVPPPPDYEFNHIPYDDWFDGDLTRSSRREKRYYRYDPEFEFDGVEGVRVTTVAGGFAGFVDPLSDRLGNDTTAFLSQVINVDNIITQFIQFLEDTNIIPQSIQAFIDWMSVYPPTYTFLEFIVLADGRRYARVWDASPYPDLYTYVDGRREAVDEMDFQQQQRFNADLASMITLASVGATPYKSAWTFGEYERRLDNTTLLEREIREALDEFGFDDLLPTGFTVADAVPGVPRETVAFEGESGENPIDDADEPFDDVNGLLFLDGFESVFDQENAGAIEYQTTPNR